MFVWHTVPDDCVPYENTLMLVDACKKAGVSVEAHLFPNGGHGLSLGTAETAWQGVNGIEPCVQVWPKLAIAWMRRTFADTDAATTGSATCRRDCRIIAIPALFSASFSRHFLSHDFAFSDPKNQVVRHLIE